MEATADLLLRLVVASAAGATLGFEREVRNHAAGIRTHALVALGSALFTIAGAYGFGDLLRAPSIDPARVAAQVASGIGFIGAGAIIRNGLAVRGLSTAATLWLGAALGLAAGAGMLAIVAGATVLVLLILVGLQLLERVAARISPTSGVLEVRYTRGHGTLGPLMRSLETANAHVVGIQVEDDDDNAVVPGVRVVSVRVKLTDMKDLARIAGELERRSEVDRVEWSEGSLTGFAPSARAA
jgi:putative Mg2+ transporter-C (MgtC) family protein